MGDPCGCLASDTNNHRPLGGDRLFLFYPRREICGLAETINGLYKAEVIHKRGPWRTKAAVELATLEWVSWFNHQRLLESIGDIPPAEAQQLYGQALAAPAAEPVLL